MTDSTALSESFNAAASAEALMDPSFLNNWSTFRSALCNHSWNTSSMPVSSTVLSTGAAPAAGLDGPHLLAMVSNMPFAI
jgi:hypothetical protein